MGEPYVPGPFSLPFTPPTSTYAPLSLSAQGTRLCTRHRRPKQGQPGRGHPLRRDDAPPPGLRQACSQDRSRSGYRVERGSGVDARPRWQGQHDGGHGGDFEEDLSHEGFIVDHYAKLRGAVICIDDIPSSLGSVGSRDTIERAPIFHLK